MVQFMVSGEKNTSIWQWPGPETGTTSLAGEQHSMKLEEVEDEGPLPKRWKPSSSQTTDQWSFDSNEFPVPPSQYNPLNEPSPLGLRLKKSPSLLELIQMRLSQGRTDDRVGNKRDVKARAGASGSGSIDKLKASNFPALLLRIGRWEYVSKHESDLIAKCYFAKHKLVWEVLNGGLKNKIEIQWADIVALKASCPEDGPGTLTILLGKQPLFFRETNPQPRKHTLWQATSDFTNGEASTHRQHYLQCAQGVLNKHYEKLIQCDTRLNFLSQQPDTVLDFPFAAEASNKNSDISGNLGLMSKGSAISDVHDMASPHTEVIFGEHGYSESFDLQGPKNLEQLKPPRLQPSMSISDLVNHIGHCISEKKSAGNLPFFENVSGGDVQKDMLEDVAQILLSDNQLTTASDEKTLMSRVNSLCCLLQDSNSAKNPQHEGNDKCTPGGDLMSGNVKKQQGDLARREDSGNVSGNKQASGMSRKDSFTDLLHQLPKIASLPKFLFDISEDGEILNP